MSENARWLAVRHPWWRKLWYRLFPPKPPKPLSPREVALNRWWLDTISETNKELRQVAEPSPRSAALHDQKLWARVDAQGAQLARLLRLTKETRRKVVLIEKQLGLDNTAYELKAGPMDVDKEWDALDWTEEDHGLCARCGEPWVPVRPGKGQPTCDCHTICPKHGHGAIEHHGDGEYEGISGWFCAKCYEEDGTIT